MDERCVNKCFSGDEYPYIADYKKPEEYPQKPAKKIFHSVKFAGKIRIKILISNIETLKKDLFTFL